jgi:predicted enzyme related to lactoylglutathione lyase
MADSPEATERLIENIIPILVVEDLSRSIEYYETVLRFSVDWSSSDFAGLSRDGWRIYLSEDPGARAGARLWIGVEDLDRLYEECRSRGATIVAEITNNPWAREFQVADPDGHVLRFGGAPETET